MSITLKGLSEDPSLRSAALRFVQDDTIFEPRFLRFRTNGTTFQVIVDQPHGLHERVDRGWTDEGPAATPQVLRQPQRDGRLRQLQQDRVSQLLRPSGRLRLPSPEVRRERAELALQLDGAA